MNKALCIVRCPSIPDTDQKPLGLLVCNTVLGYLKTHAATVVKKERVSTLVSF